MFFSSMFARKRIGMFSKTIPFRHQKDLPLFFLCVAMDLTMVSCLKSFLYLQLPIVRWYIFHQCWLQTLLSVFATAPCTAADSFHICVVILELRKTSIITNYLSAFLRVSSAIEAFLSAASQGCHGRQQLSVSACALCDGFIFSASRERDKQIDDDRC